MNLNLYLGKAPLGKEVAYPETYDPLLLCPIPRSLARKESFSCHGYDLWRAYELSWLGKTGKPEAAIADFIIDANSPFLIESKSFKLYLQSLCLTSFASRNSLVQTLEKDLSIATGAPVSALLDVITMTPEAELLDTIDCSCSDYLVNKELLKVAGPRVQKRLVSHLFKSNCLVTGQPDFASMLISYEGPLIDEVGLLQYLVSYRRHMGLHEQCVEQIFDDLHTICCPDKLTVVGAFTRRGGLDITPCRSTEKVLPQHLRFIRQ